MSAPDGLNVASILATDYFKQPVIDETGLAETQDLELHWNGKLKGTEVTEKGIFNHGFRGWHGSGHSSGRNSAWQWLETKAGIRLRCASAVVPRGGTLADKSGRQERESEKSSAKNAKNAREGGFQTANHANHANNDRTSDPGMMAGLLSALIALSAVKFPGLAPRAPSPAPPSKRAESPSY